MLNSNELLTEIYKEKQIIKYWFSSTFKNKEDEKEFSLFKIQFYNKLRLYLGIVFCVYLIFNLTFGLIWDKLLFYDKIFKGIILFANIILLILIKRSDVDSRVNIIFCYIKFFINVLFYLDVIIFFMRKFIINKDPSNKVDVIRHFYMTVILTILEYSIYLKPSKLISNVIASLFLITLAVGGFINEKEPLYLLSEIIVSLTLYILFRFSEIMWNFKREMFVCIKQTETISQYYESLVNNMEIQVVSLLDNKFIMFNNAFYKELPVYKDEDNLNIQTNQNNSILEKSNLRIKAEEQSNNENKNKNSSISSYLSKLVKSDNLSISLLDIINTSIYVRDKANQRNLTANFISLGTFILKNNNRRFFNIFYRVFNISKDIIESKQIMMFILMKLLISR